MPYRPGGPRSPQKSRPLRVHRWYLTLTLTVLLTAVPASASADQWVDPTPGQVTAHDIARAHDIHGHHQGDPGHRWVDYQRQASQLRGYLRAVARAQAVDRMASCARDPHCAARLAAFLTRAPYRLFAAIIGCESGWNPSAANPSSTAGGLLQYLESTWAGVAPIYGMAGRSRFEVWPAAWVGANHLARGGPGPWAASQHCWS